MTRSICIRYGAAKVGAFSPCAACQHDPAREADKRTQAKCLWLSDQYLSSEKLEAFGALIRNHEPVPFDEKRIDSLVGQLGTLQFPAIVKASTGWSLWTWSLLGLGVGLSLGIAVVLALLLRR